MNVYNCWYHGITGYACKLARGKWMFVPELGQISNRVHRNLILADLTFRNSHEFLHEVDAERVRGKPALLHWLKKQLFPADRANTIGGHLFMAR